MGTKPLTPGDLQHIADKMRIAKGQEPIDHAKKEEQERHALREAFMTRDLHPEVMERVNTHARIDDPLRQWKLSPMDLPSRERWYDYSRARDMMLKATDTEESPWYIVPSDDKRRARLNCISHLLTLIPWKSVRREKIKLPKRSNKGAYDDQASLKGRRFVPDKY